MNICKTVLSAVASEAMVMARAILFVYYKNCESVCHRNICFARMFKIQQSVYLYFCCMMGTYVHIISKFHVSN
jgi:hypothetical protein